MHVLALVILAVVVLIAVVSLVQARRAEGVRDRERRREQPATLEGAGSHLSGRIDG